jgi:hypothetical protein
MYDFEFWEYAWYIVEDLPTFRLTLQMLSSVFLVHFGRPYMDLAGRGVWEVEPGLDERKSGILSNRIATTW